MSIYARLSEGCVARREISRRDTHLEGRGGGRGGRVRRKEARALQSSSPSRYGRRGPPSGKRLVPAGGRTEEGEDGRRCIYLHTPPTRGTPAPRRPLPPSPLGPLLHRSSPSCDPRTAVVPCCLLWVQLSLQHPSAPPPHPIQRPRTGECAPHSCLGIRIPDIAGFAVVHLRDRTCAGTWGQAPNRIRNGAIY